MPDHDRMSRRTLLASGGAALLTACASRSAVVTQGTQNAVVSPDAAGASGSRNVNVDDDLPRMLGIAGVPGVSIAIIEGDRATARGVGVTRAGGSDAVNADTVFEAASLSKPVFAYLVLRLVSEGALELDKPLNEYVPLPNSGDARAKSITARHALSHSSGWRNWRNIATHTLTSDFEPGARFSYSGEGFYFLSRVVEKVTGRGILRLTRERIFEPLGMRRSSYMWSPELDTNRADPHTNRGVPGDSFGAQRGKGFRDAAAAAGKPMEEWTHEDAERVHPSINKDQPAFPNFLLPNVAGSLLTTANDYAKFLSHLMLGDGRAILDQMQAPQVAMNKALRWGLGVGLQSSGARTQFWHWGDNFGFKNFVLGDSSAKEAIAVFTNGQNGRAIYERVIRAVRGDQPAFLWI
jgi:CubicO group peptidase (beta-lactamase class C family)